MKKKGKRSVKKKAKKTVKKTENREDKFCYGYVLHLNATKAAISAGYSERSARATGCRMLTKSNILEKIKYLQDHLSETSEISALRVLKEHEKIAFTGAGRLREGWMTLKDFESLTADEKDAIQEVNARETICGTEIRVRLYDRQRALDSISKMLGYAAPVKAEITGKGGTELFPVNLVFSPTPLTAKDLEDIKKIQSGKNEEDSADAGISET